MFGNTENKEIKPHWVSEEEWGNMRHIDRLKLLRNYASDVTSTLLLLDIREEVRYYERVLRQIGELTK